MVQRWARSLVFPIPQCCMAMWRITLLVLVLLLAVVEAFRSFATERAVENEESKKEEDKYAGICSDWYNGRPPDCNKTGLARLVAALQDENCEAALMSPANTKLVGGKFSKLASETAFVFLRGTAAFYYYDMACEDPTFISIQKNLHAFVTSNGDCHPENFGSVEQANGKLAFVVNDFDQVTLSAPPPTPSDAVCP